MCGALCGSVILSKDIPAIREWSPIYLVITVIVVMSEKVDTTITKGKLHLCLDSQICKSVCTYPPVYTLIHTCTIHVCVCKLSALGTNDTQAWAVILLNAVKIPT